MNLLKIKSIVNSVFFFVFIIALFKLLIHLLTSGNYGYGWGELFYLDLSRHLDWGYVAFPSLTVLFTKIGFILFGKSLLGIRVMPAIAGVIIIILTALLTKELGGKKLALIVASFSVLIAPIFLLFGTLLEITAYEPVFWIGSIYALAAFLNRGSRNFLLLFGLFFGLGVQNKYTILFLGLSLILSLFLTFQRKILKNYNFLLAISLAFVMCIPNILWQVGHNLPIVDFFIYRFKGGSDELHLSFGQYLLNQIIMLNFATLPLILGGVYFFLKDNKFRFIGLTYLILLFMVFMLHGNKIYYLAPIYPALFAGGAVMFEKWFNSVKYKSIFILPIGIFLFLSIIEAPLWLPVMSAENYIKYSSVVKLAPQQMWSFKQEELPQIISGFYGMEEMTQKVAEFYNRLPFDLKAQTTIFASNYGEAAAINFLGAKYNLPRAINNNLDYYYFGPPNYSVQNIIFVGGYIPPIFYNTCTSVEKIGSMSLAYAPSFVNQPYYFCKNIKMPLKTIWPSIKNLGDFTG